MENKIGTIEGTSENLGLYYVIDVPVDARAVVIVLHGMMEHSQRYSHLRESLVKGGFGYAAMDLPGHGKSIVETRGPGYWIENGCNSIADEIGKFIIKLKDTTGLPVIIFGHSMGSFLAKGIISGYGRYLKGCILSGTNDRQSGLLLVTGKISASLIILIKGEEYKSRFLHNMAFGNYNKKIKPIRTKYDWLSTDVNEVDKYNLDPLCGFYCSALLYKDFSGWLLKIYNKKKLAEIPSDLPIYIFSGGEDPVGNYGRGLASLRNRFLASGKKKLSLRIYDGKRHECLNETNRDEVLEHINEFCNEVLEV